MPLGFRGITSLDKKTQKYNRQECNMFKNNLQQAYIYLLAYGGWRGAFRSLFIKWHHSGVVVP